MDALTAAAASGIRARIDSLDMLANNLANASASGFKSDSESYGLYISPDAADSPEGTYPAILAVIQSRWTDFSQGALLPTGNSTDLALSGKGFFVASTSSGPLYTRNGNFRLSPKGQIETLDGYAVESNAGLPIVLDTSKPFEVTPQGIVRQDAQDVSQLAVVNFTDPSVLTKRNGTYFQNSPPGPDPAAATAVEVRQGKLEAPNSESAHSAAQLVSVLRQFEALQKAMTIGADMNRRAVEDVAKVGP
jgi:flagellar basal-body rod protein FlgF